MNTDERVDKINNGELLGSLKTYKMPVYDKAGDEKPLFVYQVEITDVDLSRIEEITEFVFRFVKK